MQRMRFIPTPHPSSGGLHDISAFPLGPLVIGYPEAIGDITRGYWVAPIPVEWTPLPEGQWRCKGTVEHWFTWTLHVKPYYDYCDFEYTLTNESDHTWEHGFAFNCLNCGALDALRDREAVRHWAKPAGGTFHRLSELPYQYNGRPGVQLYSVKGQPKGADLPFVASFKATPPDLVLEGWLAITSRYGRGLVASVSKPALFLFQNLEYSCIHSATDFGRLEPGQTGRGMNRVYAVTTSLEEWYERMRAELFES